MRRFLSIFFIAAAIFPAAAQTKAGIFYEISTCVLRLIVIPDDDTTLGTTPAPKSDETMIVVDRDELPMTVIDGVEMVDVRWVKTCKR
jgi:hypothetical protein